MRTIHTRTYTNVALTAIILLLAALVIRPYVSMPSAQAQLADYNDRDAQQREKAAALDPSVEMNAKATQDVAAANREIAQAIRDAAKAQNEIARAINKLSAETE